METVESIARIIMYVWVILMCYIISDTEKRLRKIEERHEQEDDIA